MSLPESIKQIINENKYSIGLVQSKDNNVPTSSAVTLIRNRRILCNIVYECETKTVHVEHFNPAVFLSQQFRDFLENSLKDVGQEVWMDKIDRNMTHPKLLEALFQYGKSYS